MASDNKLRLTWLKALPTNISCNSFEQFILKALSTTEFKSYTFLIICSFFFILIKLNKNLLD